MSGAFCTQCGKKTKVILKRSEKHESLIHYCVCAYCGKILSYFKEKESFNKCKVTTWCP